MGNIRTPSFELTCLLNQMINTPESRISDLESQVNYSICDDYDSLEAISAIFDENCGNLINFSSVSNYDPFGPDNIIGTIGPMKDPLEIRQYGGTFSLELPVRGIYFLNYSFDGSLFINWYTEEEVCHNSYSEFCTDHSFGGDSFLSIRSDSDDMERLRVDIGERSIRKRLMKRSPNPGLPIQRLERYIKNVSDKLF